MEVVVRRAALLDPDVSWDEWPQTGAGKQRVRVSKPGEPVFIANGLFD